MKPAFYFCTIMLVAFSFSGMAQNVIFLHHSTGAGVYSQGNVAGWIETYNSENGTSYSISEKSYPDSPYPWENYPYDYWNLWINGACSNSEPNIQCLDELCASFDVIIFKHCFPGADISSDDQTSSIGSSNKTIGNYKLQYRALRDLMDTYPDNKFIVWTLAPLHRLATNTENAARARTFVDWVKNEWLQEDGKEHNNIYIFDFYNYVAETNPSPANGAVNCLKYDYEGDHANSDSHPNSLANQTVGPLFAEFIVSTIRDMPATASHNELKEPVISADKNILRVQSAKTSKNRILSIYGLTGNKIITLPAPELDFTLNINFLPEGLYILVVSENQKSWSCKISKQ
jgi:hypothetical protein